ncbi:hypothetical protein H6G89_27165 [Oscillatoria sp. FACHB-1407]|uniref:hypothetical protein n=1 Tax=Oscillatoria sp. FACHB-1407 TaxID=2692847 RepID=UPI001688BC0D|nr:hypothetical protein [Oscillatoria sp. FACHB-1407]MBD2464691.1 hypothetical protein [Oscillatoria sp. FACHB-1407]
MSAALKPVNRDRLLPSQSTTSLQRSSASSGADVIQFPTSARTRRERQQLAQQQVTQHQITQHQGIQGHRGQHGQHQRGQHQHGQHQHGQQLSNSLRSPQPTTRLPERANSLASLPNPQAIPAWLQLLTTAQKTSSLVTLALVVGVLTIYGWTVHIQQVWGREYRRLETLQQQERQLTTASEVLKHQLALQAENPATGLVQPTPDNAIFLEPAPPRPAPVVVETPSLDMTTAAPLGY